MSSSRPEWRLVSPAPRVAALALAGAHARVRRLVLAQLRQAESTAIFRGGELLAIAFFGRHGWRRVEMALAIVPAAAPHMRMLVRMAQLTLTAMAETRLIVLDPWTEAGRRMALLTGFRPSRRSRLMVFRSKRNGETP